MKVLIGPNGDMDLENSIPELSDQFPDVEFLVSTSYVEAAQQVVDVDIIVGWINQAILEAAKNLKWIQSISSGTNYYLNIPGLVDSDILLTSASGTHGACLAESAMGMIFAFTRGIRKCIQSQNTRQWSEHRYIRSNMRELTGSTMGIIGFLALGANLLCAILLLGFKDSDINMRSAWLCSRNDVLANFGVLLAAGGVASTHSPWPDLFVGISISGLILKSAMEVLRDAKLEIINHQNLSLIHISEPTRRYAIGEAVVGL